MPESLGRCQCCNAEVSLVVFGEQALIATHREDDYGTICRGSHRKPTKELNMEYNVLCSTINKNISIGLFLIASGLLYWGHATKTLYSENAAGVLIPAAIMLLVSCICFGCYRGHKRLLKMANINNCPHCGKKVR